MMQFLPHMGKMALSNPPVGLNIQKHDNFTPTKFYPHQFWQQAMSA